MGAKYGLPYIEPFFMLAIRFAITGAVLGIFVLVLRKRWLTPKQLLGQTIVGVLLHGMYLGGVFYAIDAGLPAGMSAIFVGLQPLVTALLGVFFLNERPNRIQKIGLACGFLGLLLVIAGRFGLNFGAVGAVGIFTCAIALMAISVGTVLQKRIGAEVPLLAGAVAQFAGAAIVMGVMSFLLETQTYEVTVPLVLSFVWLIFGLSILAILLLMVMIREGEVARVSSYFYLVPAVTVIETWVLFGETLSPLSIVGCALAVLGVFLVVRQSAQG